MPFDVGWDEGEEVLWEGGWVVGSGIVGKGHWGEAEGNGKGLSAKGVRKDIMYCLKGLREWLD